MDNTKTAGRAARIVSTLPDPARRSRLTSVLLHRNAWLRPCGSPLAKVLRHLALALALGVQIPAMAATLYTIGPDALSVPDVLTSLTTAGVPATVATLPQDAGGGPGYNGGLAFRPGAAPANDRLFAIGNDSFGASTLFSFDTAGGSFATVLPLGSGFNGGLAYNSGDGAFYMIGNDIFGASTLYQWSPGDPLTLNTLGSLGSGFFGGLTYNADDGKLYAISGDSLGVMRTLNAITLGGAAPAVAALFDLGDGSLGFNGGLAYDDAGDLFYAIANDFLANSTLTSFTLAGSGAFAAIAGFGQGFLNVGLALGPAGTAVPEPAGLALVAAALAALAWALRQRRRATAARGGRHPRNA